LEFFITHQRNISINYIAFSHGMGYEIRYFTRGIHPVLVMLYRFASVSCYQQISDEIWNESFLRKIKIYEFNKL
jgi:hypothetical protein